MLSILLDQKGFGCLQNSDTPNDLEDTRAKKNDQHDRTAGNIPVSWGVPHDGTFISNDQFMNSDMMNSKRYIPPK